MHPALCPAGDRAARATPTRRPQLMGSTVPAFSTRPRPEPSARIRDEKHCKVPWNGFKWVGVFVPLIRRSSFRITVPRGIPKCLATAIAVCVSSLQLDSRLLLRRFATPRQPAGRPVHRTVHRLVLFVGFPGELSDGSSLWRCHSRPAVHPGERLWRFV